MAAKAKTAARKSRSTTAKSRAKKSGNGNTPTRTRQPSIFMGLRVPKRNIPQSRSKVWPISINALVELAYGLNEFDRTPTKQDGTFVVDRMYSHAYNFVRTHENVERVGNRYLVTRAMAVEYCDLVDANIAKAAARAAKATAKKKAS